jgi:hypothetical protein
MRGFVLKVQLDKDGTKLVEAGDGNYLAVSCLVLDLLR